MKVTAYDLTPDAVNDILTDALTDTRANTQPAAPDTLPAGSAAQAETKEVKAAAYYARCHQQLLDAPDALEWLSAHCIEMFDSSGKELEHTKDLGFEPAFSSKITGDSKPALIVPVSASNFVAVDIREGLTGDAARCQCTNAGQPDIYGDLSALDDVMPVYVTDDVIDALSIQQQGLPALALNTSTNTTNSAAGKLIAYLTEHAPQAALILCGERAAGLTDALKRLNVSYIKSKVTHANAELITNCEAFHNALLAEYDEKPDNTCRYIESEFADDIERFKRNPARKTGFVNFDGEAGGLFCGLYVLAAISSLGKTTWALQVADYLATTGNDVIFFSLEQSRLELVSKSLSRLTAQSSMKDKVTSLDIRRGYMPQQVKDAIEVYKDATNYRLSIVEGNFNCDIGYISNYVREYIKRTGRTPVVIVDYLQILQPSADGKLRNSKREEMDIAVTELKRLTRELDITLLVISAVNRTNYMTTFAFESLKETGQIEYTADVVLGLQLACLDEDTFSKETGITAKRDRINAAKEEYPRKIKLVCLKNRYGKSYFENYFQYYPDCDLFTAMGKPATTKKR